MSINPWQAWLVFALLLLLADVFLVGGSSGVLLILALAATGGMAAALLGLDQAGQVASAAIIGIIATPVVIWILRRVASQSSASARTDSRVANRTFEIVRQRDRLGIRVFGEFLPARTVDGSNPPLGQEVRVERFEGIHAVVSPLPGRPDESAS